MSWNCLSIVHNFIRLSYKRKKVRIRFGLNFISWKTIFQIIIIFPVHVAFTNIVTAKKALLNTRQSKSPADKPQTTQVPEQTFLKPTFNTVSKKINRVFFCFWSMFYPADIDDVGAAEKDNFWDANSGIKMTASHFVIVYHEKMSANRAEKKIF